MNINILALDGVFDTGLSAMLDTFATANELARAQALPAPALNVQVVGMRKHVRTARGFAVPVTSVDASHAPDWVLVPALNLKQPEQLLAALTRRDVQDGQRHLRERSAEGVRIAAACLGTFMVADAGLLDGHEATTTWSLAPLFRQRFPAVRLREDRMVVASGRMVTAGAMMGHLDLALWLLRHVSPDLARLVAHLMLIDERALQATYIVPDYLAHADPLVSRFERWARERLTQGFSLPQAAAALHVHPRTLQRRTELVLGKSPLSFFQDLRIQRAQELVSQGWNMEAIAGEVGYANASTLRTLMRRRREGRQAPPGGTPEAGA